MFKRNDGIGDNAIQNRFTALLKKSLHNRKVDYVMSLNKKYDKEFPIDLYNYSIGQEYDFLKAIINYEVIRSAFKNLSDRERKILVLHIIEDKDFNEIGKLFGLSYKGTATVFYKTISKLRESLGRYRDELW